MEIVVRNVNELFSEMFWKFRTFGMPAGSRNGEVIVIPEPVLTTIEQPRERVLFDEKRDANPIFHALEGLHMLAGRRDVAFLQQFNSRIGQYSDDGEVFNAAYGYRMRHHFGLDQLHTAVKVLRETPDTRQCIIQLWDPADLDKKTLDKACNVQLIFSVSRDRLDMLVINRSNDAWFGYAGANPVHFTIIHEYVAAAAGYEVGKYRTFTNNLHLYTKLYDTHDYVRNPPDTWASNAYLHGVKPRRLVNHVNPETFLLDCEQFCNNPFEPQHYYNDWFNEVAYPMAMISKTRKEKLGDGYYWVERIEAEDWQLACRDWVDRREKAKLMR